MTPQLLSSTSIEGTNVYNLEGEKIGHIKDLMVDWQTGEVAYFSSLIWRNSRFWRKAICHTYGSSRF